MHTYPQLQVEHNAPSFPACTAGVYGFSATRLCYTAKCYTSITAKDAPIWAGKASAITGQWEGGTYWVYFIGGDSGASNSIIRMASTSPYTATTLATSSGTGSLNDLFRGLTLSPTLPVVAPPIVALRLTNGGAALSATNGNAIVIDQYNGTALVSSTPVPPTQCSLDGAAVNTYVYEGRLSQSSAVFRCSERVTRVLRDSCRDACLRRGESYCLDKCVKLCVRSALYAPSGPGTHGCYTSRCGGLLFRCSRHAAGPVLCLSCRCDYDSVFVS